MLQISLFVILRKVVAVQSTIDIIAKLTSLWKGYKIMGTVKKFVYLKYRDSL